MQSAVSAFLADFKTAAAASGINFWPTKKNDAFLSKPASRTKT